MKRARVKGTINPPREYSIARALASFDPEDEAAICAFLEETEKRRLEGFPEVTGWGISRAAGGCMVVVQHGEHDTSDAVASTFREAIKLLSERMIAVAMDGAPDA